MIIFKLGLGVLLFAIAFAVVCWWGNERRRRKPLELRRRLVEQGKYQVERKLNTQGSLTLQEIANHLASLKVSSQPDFLELRVQNAKTFAEFVVKYLEQENRIVRVNAKGKQLFKLVKR
ncbi:MAG TPA: hypothetical protein VFF14_01270 [Candidatus Deferrimicrobium sp.]|nr:hypothetical protein [Candidatus Deferrimicrobium sp.]